MDFEKKLDATIMRKRLDIQEALGKPTKVPNTRSMTFFFLKISFIFYCFKIRRTLRLFISNTSTDQSSNAEEENAFDLNMGNVPNWVLKIEGRLLDVKPDIITLRVFSKFLFHLVY